MSTGEFTDLLAQSKRGDAAAHDRLVRLIHAELRKIARRHLVGNRWIATLSTTVLISEAYVRLVSPGAQHVETRAHYLNLASQAMRQIVCDYARKRMRELQHIDREADPEVAAETIDPQLTQARQLVALDEALSDLARIKPRLARVVECRYFSGMSVEETAEALSTSVRTVHRDWIEAKEWLERSLFER
jgi:RNA polymerase sigma factor (TIGR02999 family)